MTVPVNPAAPYRVACTECDTDRADGITALEFSALYQQGWRCVDPDLSRDRPDDVYRWWTHLGYCPDCAPATLRHKEAGGD